jgi:CRP-like cAMP-binding protein
MHAARRSRLFCVAGRNIRAMLDANPSWWRGFYMISHANLTLALRLLGDVLALSPTGRVARRLLELADDAGAISVTRDELAALVGATRPTVQRTLATLVAEGAIETGYRTIRVRRRGLLEAHAVIARGR